MQFKLLYYITYIAIRTRLTIRWVAGNTITQVQFLSIIGTVGGSQADPGAREFSKSFGYLDAAMYDAMYAAVCATLYAAV